MNESNTTDIKPVPPARTKRPVSSTRSGTRSRSGTTRRTSAPRPWWQRKRSYPMPLTQQQVTTRTWLARFVILLLAFAVGPLVFWSPAGMRAVPALAVTSVLFMLLLRATRQGMMYTLIYLSIVGGLRRWLIPALGWAEQDPLLLVGSALTLLYFFNLMLTRRLHRDTILARLLLWLLVVMFLEVFNPLQGGIGVGLGGIIFVIVPILWYYYGRDYANERVLNTVLLTIVGISLIGAAYGLYQTWFGFLPSEEMWIKLNPLYTSLQVSDTVRAFSFFVSAQEYAQVLSLSIVILWAGALRGLRFALLPIPFLAWALFLESSRGSIVITLAICVVMWAVQGRTWAFWAPRLVLAGVIAVVGLSSGLNKAQETKFDDKTQSLVDHQVNGLLKPMDAKTSTAGTHAGMVGVGLLQGFTTPVGQGLGSTTVAGNKMGGEMHSTEIDASDNFVGLGFAGGLLYLAVIVTVLSMAVRYWNSTRTLTSLAVLGCLLVTLGQWDHGSLYAVSTFSWICIGGLDRAMRQQGVREKTKPSTPEVAPIPQAVQA